MPLPPDRLKNDLDWGDRNFMAQPPKIQQMGDVWAVSQDNLLSPPAVGRRGV